MYSLVFFLVLSLAQYLFYLWKRSDLRDYQEVVNGVANFSGADKHRVYKKSVIFLNNMLGVFKGYLWIPVAIVLVLNGVVSLIIGSLTHLIVSFF